ncbi:hypothetical protein Avbf_05162 [Armadillidium vulgare]|nr:hypothetical protein Avbf_05162 [Armadillidium vulgare]
MSDDRKKLKERIRELEGMEVKLNQVSALVVKEIEALENKLFAEVYRADAASNQAAKVCWAPGISNSKCSACPEYRH